MKPWRAALTLPRCAPSPGDGPAPVAAAGLVPADGHAAGGEAALTAASTAALPAPRQTSQNHAPAAAYPADDATADGALPAVHGETGMTRTWRAHDRAGTPVLDVRTVSFKYANKRILREVDFAIYPGEIMVLLGPNGAGKSTLAKLITGRNTPASGRIRIQSGDPTTDADARAAIGIVPQQVAVYPKLTALENLIAFGRLLGLPAALADTAARKNLRRVGLEDRTHARVDTLSGGMQRRVNIAAALLHNPKLLVLDEPTVGVDLASRTALADVLKDLRTEGLAIMLTTHDLTEAETLADRITVLVQGQVVAQGTPDSVIAEAFGGRRHLTVSVSPASAAMNARGPDGRVGSVSMHTRQAYDTTLITRLRDAAGRMGLTSEDGGMTWSGLIDVSDPQVRGGMQEILAASPVTRDVRLRRPGLDALLQHLTPGAPQSRDGAALTDRSDVSPV
ncbi:MAG: ABC transporter ATP-binding protein [Pseudomonadota bacterium]